MKDITAETTIGQLGFMLFKAIKEEAAFDMVQHTSISDNIIKGEVFNINPVINDRLTIILKASINGNVIEKRKEYTSEELSVTTSFTLKGGVIITKDIMDELKGEIMVAVIKSLNL